LFIVLNMDKVPDKTKVEVKQMLDARLVSELTQAGVPIEQVEVMDRPPLMNAWVEIVDTGVAVNQVGESSSSSS
jgi:hypothetical protein